MVDPSLTTATLGIQIIPIDQVQNIAATIKAPGSNPEASGTLIKADTPPSDVSKIAEKVVKNVSELCDAMSSHSPYANV